MKKLVLLTLFILLVFSTVKAQEKKHNIPKKPNPIIFADIGLGITNGYLRGLTGTFSLNYQTKNNLFTFKSLELVQKDSVDFFIIFPVNIELSKINEYSFLYGKRYIEDGYSYHFSGGVSYNIYKQIKNDTVLSRESFWGFPLEFGISWFKSKKKKIGLLYGLIPVGKPTSFGRSIGFKLHVNIAKKTYVGLALNYSLGWHKVYNN